jgi:hypothetical protein
MNLIDTFFEVLFIFHRVSKSETQPNKELFLNGRTEQAHTFPIPSIEERKSRNENQTFNAEEILAKRK